MRCGEPTRTLGDGKSLFRGSAPLSSKERSQCGAAEVFPAGLAQSMKAFHAEPIKRDLDKNQTPSCPGNPCLESVIHWLNRVCHWWVSRGGGGRGSFSAQISSIRVQSGRRNRAVTLCFPQREISRKGFRKLMSWWKALEQWRKRQSPQGLDETQFCYCPFNETE